MSETPPLPEDTDRLAEYPDFSSDHLTLERDKDGLVYLVSWRFGVSTVVAVVKPGGSVVALDEWG